ncbi:MAG: glycosyl hydrolase, partial [Gemmatimonadaceae bacterium]
MPRLQKLLGLSLLPAALVLAAAGWTHDRHPAPRHAPPVAPPVDTAVLDSFKWRNIGPERGGRSIAVSGVRGQPKVAYFGATGGGLWKTTDGGDHWAPVTDGQITSASVGAVAVSETNPDEVLIGTGESEIRGNIMPGDGIYRSMDAGKTWTHVAFRHVDAISKIRIDPTDPNIAFAAVFGQYAEPSEDRGVFKSTDGGVTWRKVLYRDPGTGGIDVEIDHNNPKVVYAALWQAFRKEYTASSGGPGSGLFKSTDGGETWTEITHNRGLPAGIDGKIGIAVSPANSNRVYALVENDSGGLFRSDDAGATWTFVNDSHDIRQRAFYYTHVYADPKDENRVYAQNTSLFESTDAGKTLTDLRGTHGDFHDLWIDPDNGQHMVVGNDGGGAVTTDGGKTWTPETYSTAQLYHVAATINYPYDVCGAQQDDGTVCVPSNAGQGRGFG